MADIFYITKVIDILLGTIAKVSEQQFICKRLHPYVHHWPRAKFLRRKLSSTRNE